MTQDADKDLKTGWAQACRPQPGYAAWWEAERILLCGLKKLLWKGSRLMDNAVFRRMTLCVCCSVWACRVSVADAERPEALANGRILLLDDFSQGLDAWSYKQDAVRIITDELTTKPALEWTLGDVGAELVYTRMDRIKEFGRYNRLRLRVRGWDTEGRLGVGCAVAASLNISGWPKHVTGQTPQWGLYDRTTAASKDWRVLEERLDFPSWYPWEQTDNHKPGLQISARAGFSSPSILRIDEIALIDDVVDMQGEWGTMTRLPDGSARCEYAIALQNRTDQPQTVAACAAAPALTQFDANIPSKVTLAPRASTTLRVQVRMPAHALAAAPALYHEELFLRLTPESLPESAMTLRLPATAPLKAPARPCLWMTADQWRAEREKFAALTPKEKSNRLRVADAWVDKPVELPKPYDRARPLTLVDGTELNPKPLFWAPTPDSPGKRAHSDAFKAVQALGEAYQLTQDIRYAKKAAAIVKAYADQLDNYPLRGFTEAREQGWSRFSINSLHEGWLLMPLCYGYDMICDVPGVLTEAEKRQIAERFFIPMGRAETPITSWYSNQTSVRNMAAALCGFNADDSSLVHHAVFGHSGLQRAINASINPDGFLTEIPANYHWANLIEVLRLGVILKNTRIDVAYRRDLLEKACRVPYLRAFPNGWVTGFGPHGYGQGAGYGGANYKPAAQLFDDPLFQQLSDMHTAKEFIANLESTYFPHSELIMLRQGKGADHQAVSFLFGNKRRAPGASLAFTWYGKGEILAPALGSLYNVTKLMKDPWTSPFYCQVNVDDHEQINSTGQLTFHTLDPGPQIASAKADEIHPGVQMERTLALHDGMLFVADRLVSTEEHNYQWAYLTMGELSTQGQFGGETIAYTNGHQQLSGQTTDGNWQAQWKRKKLTLAAWMLGAPGTQVLTGESYIAPCGDAWRTPLVLARRHAKETVFLAVLAPQTDQPKIQSIQAEPLNRSAIQASAMRVTATDGTQYVFVVNYTGAALSGKDWKCTDRAELTVIGR